MIEIIPNWHPVLVHFTVALVLTSLALYVVSFVMGETKCRQEVQLIARWNLWFGAAASVLTVLAGIYAYNTVAHDTPSHAAMTEHRNWALATFVVVLQVAIWAWLRHRKKLAVNLQFLGAFVLGGVLMVSTAWHGAELVYRYGLGVMSLPKKDDHGHAPGEAHAHDSDEHSHDQMPGHDEDEHSHSNDHDEIDMGDMSMDDMEMEMDASSHNSGHHDDGHNHEH